MLNVNFKQREDTGFCRYLKLIVIFYQIDIMQMCIVEMHERPGSPLYHLENFIEGHYVKYNSNSGFVRDDDENARWTPQV